MVHISQPAGPSRDLRRAVALTVHGWLCWWYDVWRSYAQYWKVSSQPRAVGVGPALSFRLPSPLRCCFIELKKKALFLTQPAKIRSSCRENPLETVWGEQIPSVFFIFRSNMTFFSPHLGPQRCFFFFSQSFSQRNLKVSDLWSR